MAASPNNQLSDTKTLDSTASISQTNGQDYPQPLTETIPPSDPQPTVDTNTGEKRKREDQDPTQNPTTDTNTEEKRKREDQDKDPTQNPTLHPLWKTSLCSYFRSHNGICSHGSTCRYAHGEEELRPRSDNTWDPTSERAKKTAEGQNGETSKEEEGKEIIMTEMVMDVENGEDCEPELSKCLVHLPMKWNNDDLKKFLTQQGVIFKSAKKKKGMAVGFVSFDNAEQLKTAVEELEGKTIGNKNLKVSNVTPRSIDKSSALDDSNTKAAKSARDAVTPLAHMSYADQLNHKMNSVTQMLKKLTRNARKACPSGVSLPQWILTSRERAGLPCKLEGIVESPLVNGYRNKCEFSVGYSQQGKPTVGFMLGNFREGVTAVEEPVDCPNVSKIACKYASILQEFLQHSSLPLWNRFKNTGFWRQLTVREGRSAEKVANGDLEANISEVMLMVQVCSVGLDDAQITSEFERLARAFAAAAAANSPPLPLTAFVVQDHQGISNVAPADAPLRSIPIPKAESGLEPETANNVVEPRIHDCISNLRFSISPTAFFQVNTLAAERLYLLAGEWAGLGPDTLLFDVCCGTGTIGLTLAHRVGMVIGIEMNASAVQDAYKNAEINGIKNCRFICSKAEDVIGSLLKEHLNVSEEQGQVSSALDSSEKIDTPEEKDTSTIDAHSGGEGTCQEPENCSENAGKELLQIQLQESSKSNDGNSLVQQFKNVVAIVDPPRMGLHPTVIKALRTHAPLRRLVYISCNPESLVANAIELCTPSPETVEKGRKDNRNWRHMSSAGLARHRAKSMPISEPFQPVKTMAVDLFPHTPHCEMVMLLER